MFCVTNNLLISNLAVKHSKRCNRSSFRRPCNLRDHRGHVRAFLHHLRDEHWDAIDVRGRAHRAQRTGERAGKHFLQHVAILWALHRILSEIYMHVHSRNYVLRFFILECGAQGPALLPVGPVLPVGRRPLRAVARDRGREPPGDGGGGGAVRTQPKVSSHSIFGGEAEGRKSSCYGRLKKAGAEN